MRDVTLFVSHHSSKLPIAEHVERALAPKGVKCWIAPRDVDPGEPFDKEVKQAIDQSSAILLLFCSKSDKSRHVKRELILADQAGKAIIPLRLEQIDPGELSYHLADSQWIDWLEQRDEIIERIANKARDFDGHAPLAASNHRAVAASLAEMPVPPPAPQPAAPTGGGSKAMLWGGAGIVAVLLAIIGYLALRPQQPAAPQPAEAPAEASAPARPAEQPAQAVAATAAPAATAPAAAAPSVQPSFPCSRARTRVEIMICGSDELADLDNRLNAAYRQARRNPAVDRAALDTEQTRWRDLDRDECPDAACVAESHRTRIAALQELAHGFSVNIAD